MSLNKQIIPAIIANNQEELEQRIYKVSDYVEIIQLDFMDGNFVPNNSIDFDFKLPKTICKFEAHLMIKDPNIWIEKNYMKVETILVHIESIKNPFEIIKMVKEKAKNIGFVLNPETNINKIVRYIDKIDQILIMTVNPGFYGSPFLPKTLEKIKKIRAIKPDLNIEVDGGITDKTINLVNEAGANFFVSGSYVIKSSNIKKSIDSLKKLIN